MNIFFNNIFFKLKVLYFNFIKYLILPSINNNSHINSNSDYDNDNIKKIDNFRNNVNIIPMNNSIKRDASSVVHKSCIKFVSLRWDNNLINVYDNEKKWLLKFKNCVHLPKLIYYDDIARCIVTQYCGENININNIPGNLFDQCLDLLKELKQMNCRHNDIKPQELLINNNILYLVDFGWAHDFNKRTPTNWPPGLGSDYKPKNNNYDDEYSLFKSLETILSKLHKKILDDVKSNVKNVERKLHMSKSLNNKKEIPLNLTFEEEEKWWKDYIAELSKPIYL